MRGKRLRRQQARGHAQLQLKREQGCTRIWSISLKLCLREQLSRQMTLLHMNKRGLQATLHVSSLLAQSVRAVGAQGARDDSPASTQTGLRHTQICSLHMISASSFICHIWGKKLQCSVIGGRKMLWDVKLHKYLKLRAFHRCVLYFTISISLVGADSWRMGGEMLNLEYFHSLLSRSFCMHGLCSADVTAGGEPNPVTHTDSRAVLSALCWRCCTLIRVEGQSALF